MSRVPSSRWLTWTWSSPWPEVVNTTWSLLMYELNRLPAWVCSRVTVAWSPWCSSALRMVLPSGVDLFGRLVPVSLPLMATAPSVALSRDASTGTHMSLRSGASANLSPPSSGAPSQYCCWDWTVDVGFTAEESRFMVPACDSCQYGSV